jgi:Ca-activated chloride channel family protein
MKNKRTLQVMITAAGLAATGVAQAGTSVSWVNPANGTTFPCGTEVTPTGQASSAGIVGGTGLDLALVIDTSGSMDSVNSGKTRIQWAREAAVALINSLPAATTAVTIITFDDDSQVYRQLTQLTPLSNVTALNSAINALSAPGPATGIGLGINTAAGELTGVRHTAGRSQQMVVLSDGFNNAGPAPVTTAVNAIAAGVDSIHTVGVPGHDASLMRDIADGPDNVVGSGDDYGVYTAVTDLTTLTGIFNGTTGNLVGLDHVEVTMPNGTTVTVPTDGLGNFSAPGPVALADGSQTWVAKAYGKDGTFAVANLTLNGDCGTSVPDAASTLPLLSLSLLGLIGMAVRRR